LFGDFTKVSPKPSMPARKRGQIFQSDARNDKVEASNYDNPAISTGENTFTVSDAARCLSSVSRS
jgi:hypothetical protein